MPRNSSYNKKARTPSTKALRNLARRRMDGATQHWAGRQGMGNAVVSCYVYTELATVPAKSSDHPEIVVAVHALVRRGCSALRYRRVQLSLSCESVPLPLHRHRHCRKKRERGDFKKQTHFWAAAEVQSKQVVGFLSAVWYCSAAHLSAMILCATSAAPLGMNLGLKILTPKRFY